MIGYITHFVQERGYSVMLYTGVSDFKDITRQLRSWNVDGAIFLGIFDSDLNRIRQDNKIPLVFTDSYSTARQLTNVGIADYHGGEIGARHLIEKGHRDLIFVGSSIESPVLRERMRGFADVCAKAGATLAPERTLPDDPTKEQIIKALSWGNKPATAVFSTSDFVALNIISILSDQGLRVPQDISVMGFDNIEMGAISIPKLTTITQDIRKKAQYSVNLLFEHISNPDTPAQNVILDVHLVERDSVAAANSI
jgi:LacI family transcriptional regulator